MKKIFYQRIFQYINEKEPDIDKTHFPTKFPALALSTFVPTSAPTHLQSKKGPSPPQGKAPSLFQSKVPITSHPPNIPQTSS